MEKVARQRDPTQHGFVNPFRGAKVGTYGAVKIKAEEFTWEYEGEEEGNDDETVRMLREKLLQEQIREAKVSGWSSYFHSFFFFQNATLTLTLPPLPCLFIIYFIFPAGARSVLRCRRCNNLQRR